MTAYERFADVLLRAELARAAAGPSAPDDPLRLPSFDDGGARALAAGALATEIGAARAQLRAELASDGPFAAIAANAALGAQAAEVLALLAAVELDDGRQRVVTHLGGTDDGALTLGVLRRVMGASHPGLAAVAPDGALSRAALARADGDGPWARRAVRLDPAVSWALTGDASVDPGLPAGVLWLDRPDDDPAAAAPTRLLLVPGPDAMRRLEVATRHAVGTRFLVTPAPDDEGAWRAIVREATLTGRTVVVQLDDDLPATARRWIERAAHLAWVVASRVELPVDQLPTTPWREVRASDATATRDEIESAFGPKAAVAHRLTAHQLEQTARVLAGRASATELTEDEITLAVRRLASGDLDKLAVRIRPRRTWDELVLPPEPLAQVRDVIDRYRHRGQVYEDWGFKPVPSAGVVAMFAGPPGTGKTLSAEIIAGELGLDLFRIDLAALVSKYIGETEKNLERIFRAAEGGTMVLLFDEADAVFGKRSEVSDSNDRYANVETSYLLQRLERYEGVALLTTNYASNIDEAFLRRIHVSVDFPSPDEPERLRLWSQSFPAGAPLDELDLAFLAREFKLTGAAIRSVTLAAAFRAASTTGRIGMAEVVTSLEAELRKQGRLTSAKAFGPYGHLLGA